MLVQLGGIYRGRRDFAKSGEFFERAMRAGETTLADDRLFGSTVASQYAYLCMDTGQYAKAEELFARSDRLAQEYLGPHNRSGRVGLRSASATCGPATGGCARAASRSTRRSGSQAERVARVLPALPEADLLHYLQAEHEPGLHKALSQSLLAGRPVGTDEQTLAWLVNGKALAPEAIAVLPAWPARAATRPSRRRPGSSRGCGSNSPH